MDQSDPLSKLVAADAKEIDRKKMADLLEPYVFFDGNTHEINFKEEFYRLKTNTDRLEMVFLGNKAKALMFEEKEGLSPLELIVLEIMPEGSVKSALKVLSDSKRILKNSEGKYYIPNYRLNEVYSKFQSN